MTFVTSDTVPTRQRAIKMRSAIVMSFVVLICVAARGDETKSTKPDPNPALPESSGQWFLEIVSESSDRPFSDSALPQRGTSLRLTGYLLEPASGQLPVRLFPATGAKPAPPEDVEFYLGFRLIDLAPESISESLPPDDFEHRSLKPVRESKTVFDGETVPREELKQAQANLAAGRPRTSIRIEKRDDGLRLSLAEKQFELKPGSVQVVSETSSGTEESPAFHRLTAVAYRHVEVASFDALRQWKLSQQLLLQGPYEAALSATEQVLLADPADEQALAQWQHLNSLIEAGRKASLLEAKLKFAAGLDNQNLLKLWKQKPAGLLYLSRRNAPPGEALGGSRIDSDTVKIPAPSGIYRVTLLLPGFRPFEQEIEINGRTKLEIPIEKSTP